MISKESPGFVRKLGLLLIVFKIGQKEPSPLIHNYIVMHTKTAIAAPSVISGIIAA